MALELPCATSRPFLYNIGRNFEQGGQLRFILIAEQIETEEEKNVLEYSYLHRVMVLFHTPAGWPAWAVVLLLTAMAATAGSIWRLLGATPALAVGAAAIQYLFFGGDALVLVSLPEKRISFGPWKAQVVVLALPRAAATGALALTGPWIGWPWALGAMLAVQALGVALLYWGAVVEPSRLYLTELEVEVEGLPVGSPPIRLLHISDLHVERVARREETVLALAEQARPDVIVITGDYVNLSYNGDAETHADVQELLRRLEAPYGVYGTLGSPPVDLREHVPGLFEEVPVRLLRDERVTLDLDGGRRLALLGVECTHHLDEDGARLAQLAAAAPDDVPRILLYHSPELMPQAVEQGVDVYLCGHTHGGQVRLPGYGAVITSSQLGREYVMGHYRRGRTHLYVSRGIGFEGLSAPRVRFLSPPEMTLVTLRPART